MQTLWVCSGRASLFVETAGAGLPVVFLHAGVADRRMWQEQVSALAPRFHTVAYDRRGFGRTEHADEAYSHVADLLAVLDAVAPAQPAVLVGCSQGGRIAIDLALAYSNRVRALVLVAPAITGAPEPTAFTAPVQALIDELEQAEAARDLDRINALEAHAWLDGPAETRGRVRGAARDLFFDMNGIALRAEPRGDEIEPADAYRRIAEITAPVLLVWGDRDFPHVVANSRHFATASQAQTLIMRGAAHLPNLEQPELFNGKLIEFCTAVVR
jgi:pimeloyl-ACP methyl ester carboxylesterase